MVRRLQVIIGKWNSLPVFQTAAAVHSRSSGRKTIGPGSGLEQVTGQPSQRMNRAAQGAVTFEPRTVLMFRALARWKQGRLSDAISPCRVRQAGVGVASRAELGDACRVGGAVSAGRDPARRRRSARFPPSPAENTRRPGRGRAKWCRCGERSSHHSRRGGGDEPPTRPISSCSSRGTQELIYVERSDVIVETGIAHGGSSSSTPPCLKPWGTAA